MNKHTPGPWRGKTVIAMTVVLEECGVSLGFGSRRTEETVANARLIAAAPELLRELEHLVKLLGYMETGGGLDVPGLATLNGARAAIAKATGAA